MKTRNIAILLATIFSTVAIAHDIGLEHEHVEGG